MRSLEASGSSSNSTLGTDRNGQTRRCDIQWLTRLLADGVSGPAALAPERFQVEMVMQLVNKYVS